MSTLLLESGDRHLTESGDALLTEEAAGVPVVAARLHLFTSGGLTYAAALAGSGGPVLAVVPSGGGGGSVTLIEGPA